MKKSSSLKLQQPKACIFNMQRCYVELYINPANHASWVQKCPNSGGSIAPIDFQLEKKKHKKKSSSPKSHDTELSYFMLSNV